jgi:uncharacterized protein YciI
MKYFILTYLLTHDYMERRGDYRKEHLALADKYHKKGSLVMGGALSRPADKAVLIFRSEKVELVQGFVEQDPYVKNCLVEDWDIREWTVVVGLL